MSVTIKCPLEIAVSEVIAQEKLNVARRREEHKNNIATMRKNAALIAKLALVLPDEAELAVYNRWSYSHPSICFPRDSLVTVRNAVGRLHVEGKELEDSEKGLIRVRLSAEQYPGIDFSYVRPLGEGMTCRIVEQTSTYKSLVCSLE